MPMSEYEITLVNEAKKGKKKSLDRLCDAFHKRLVETVEKELGNRDKAEAIITKVCEKIKVQIKSIQNPADFENMILSMTQAECANYPRNAPGGKTGGAAATSFTEEKNDRAKAKLNSPNAPFAAAPAPAAKPFEPERKPVPAPAPVVPERKPAEPYPKAPEHKEEARGDAYRRDERDYGREPEPYRRDERDYDRRQEPYRRDERDYDRRSDPYRRDDRDYDRRSDLYRRDDRDYDRRSDPYRRDDRDYDRRPDPYRRDDRDYDRRPDPYRRDERDYDRRPDPYRRDDRDYDRRSDPYRRDDRGTYADEKPRERKEPAIKPAAYRPPELDMDEPVTRLYGIDKPHESAEPSTKSFDTAPHAAAKPAEEVFKPEPKPEPAPAAVPVKPESKPEPAPAAVPVKPEPKPEPAPAAVPVKPETKPEPKPAVPPYQPPRNIAEAFADSRRMPSSPAVKPQTPAVPSAPKPAAQPFRPAGQNIAQPVAQPFRPAGQNVAKPAAQPFRPAGQNVAQPAAQPFRPAGQNVAQPAAQPFRPAGQNVAQPAAQPFRPAGQNVAQPAAQPFRPAGQNVAQPAAQPFRPAGQKVAKPVSNYQPAQTPFAGAASNTAFAAQNRANANNAASPYRPPVQRNPQPSPYPQYPAAQNKPQQNANSWSFPQNPIEDDAKTQLLIEEPGKDTMIGKSKAADPKGSGELLFKPDAVSGAPASKSGSAHIETDNTPKVGLLVCTRGANAGSNFSLKAGKNRIGITDDCDIRITDDSLTADCSFEISFDERREMFSLVPGKIASKLFLNNEYVDSSIFMQPHDTVRIGDSEFLLVSYK